MEKNESILILKLNLAGSGQVNFRKAGKSTYLDQGVTDQYFAIQNEKYKDFIDGTSKENCDLGITKEELVKNSLCECDLFYALDKKSYEELYDHKKKTYYQNVRATRLTLVRPGPGANVKNPTASKGTFDSGKYSINSTVKLCEKIIKFLIEKLNKKFGKIYLRIKGHSRGGTEGSILRKNLTPFLNKFKNVTTSTLSLDSVPGADSAIGRTVKYDKNNTDDNFRDVIVVSVNPNRSWGFVPQRIIGADVVVFTSLGHSVGTDNVYYDKDREKYTKPKWKYNDRIYNYGRLDELPDGVYYQKNQTVFKNEKVNNALELQNMIEDTKTPDPIVLDFQLRNALNLSLLIELEKINPEDPIDSLKNMYQKLDLKKTLKAKSNREDIILDLLNEKFPQDNKEFTYNSETGFSFKAKKETITNFFSNINKNLKRILDY